MYRKRLKVRNTFAGGAIDVRAEEVDLSEDRVKRPIHRAGVHADAHEEIRWLRPGGGADPLDDRGALLGTEVAAIEAQEETRGKIVR